VVLFAEAPCVQGSLHVVWLPLSGGRERWPVINLRTKEIYINESIREKRKVEWRAQSRSSTQATLASAILSLLPPRGRGGGGQALTLGETPQGAKIVERYRSCAIAIILGANRP